MLLAGVAEEATVSTLFVTRLFVTVSVLDVVNKFTPSTAILPADTREIVVSVACHTSTDPTVIAFVVP